MSRGLEEVLGPPCPPTVRPGAGARAAAPHQKPRPCPPLSNWVKGKAPSTTCSCLCGLITDTGQTWRRNIKQTRISNKKSVLVSPKSRCSGTEPHFPLAAAGLPGDLTSSLKTPKVGDPQGCVTQRYGQIHSCMCCAEIGKDKHVQEIFS